MYKNVQFALPNSKCVFMVRIGEDVDCEPMFLAAGYMAVQTNVARDAFRAATTIPQYMTSVQLNLLSANCLWLMCPGVHVLLTVWLRYRYVWFSARRSCIMNLEIPGYDEGPKGRGILEMRRAGWCLAVSHGAGAVAKVQDSCEILFDPLLIGSCVFK